MDSIMPYIYVVLFCCIGPIMLIAFGFYLGRNGMPIRIVAGRRANRHAGRYAVDE